MQRKSEYSVSRARVVFLIGLKARKYRRKIYFYIELSKKGKIGF